MVDYYAIICILFFMIYDTAGSNPGFDKIIGAFSSATRRNIILQLFEEDMTVNQIADKNHITKQAASKQKNILAESGIIKEMKSGRHVYCRINPEALTALKEYINTLESFWENRLGKLKDLVEKG